MLRISVLACLLQLVVPFRVSSRSSKQESLKGSMRESNEESLNLTEGSDYVEDVLDFLDTKWVLDNVEPSLAPADVGLRFLQDLAQIDFSGDVPGQVKQIAVDLGLQAVGAIANAINPLLGVAFSLFSNIFLGRGGSDLGTEILKKVELLFDQAKVERMKAAVTSSLKEAMQQIAQTDTTNETDARALWLNVPGNLASSQFEMVFTEDCWKLGDDDDVECDSDCYKWRTADGGAWGLLMEIQYVELMVQVAVTMLEYNILNVNWFRQVNQAVNQINFHYWTFRNWRLADPGYSVKRGRIQCGGTTQNRRCTAERSVDELLNRTICEELEERCNRRGCGSALQASLQQTQDECIQNHKDMIDAEIEDLNQQRQGFGGFVSKFQYTAQAGGDNLKLMSRRRRNPRYNVRCK